MPARFFLPAFLLGALVSPPLAAADEPSSAIAANDSAWEKATLYLFKESYQEFRQLESREALLGRAALLLLQQPKTQANLDQAVAELETLAATTPADEPAIAARYLLGRIAHTHRTPADLPAAAAHYRRLVAEHPAHRLGEQALIKLALIEIYEPGLAPEERLARFERYGRQAEELRHAGSRRDLHLLLANACTNLRLDEALALRHYMAAERAGVGNPVLRANVIVAAGELARRLGRADLAREYFERYLAEFSRDYRRAFVKDKLAALPVTPATPAPEAKR